MSDDLIFREVDEELRQDQMARLWKRYGGFIVAVAVLIVLGVAGFRGWQWYSAKQAAEAGARYEEVLRQADAGKEGDALAVLDKLEREAPGGYALLTRFTAAGLKAKTGDIDGAIAAYDALAVQTDDAALRDLARIEAARLLVDRGDQANVEQRVAPILGENSVWRNAAREMIGLAAVQAGDIAAAASQFRQIATDAAASQEIRQRAELMLAVLAPREAEALTKAADDGAAAKETAQ